MKIHLDFPWGGTFDLEKPKKDDGAKDVIIPFLAGLIPLVPLVLIIALAMG